MEYKEDNTTLHYVPSKTTFNKLMKQKIWDQMSFTFCTFKSLKLMHIFRWPGLLPNKIS